MNAPLWIVTRCAVSAVDGDAAPDPDQAALWGAGRVFGLEHPERWGGLLDLPPDPDDRSVQRVLGVLAGAGGGGPGRRACSGRVRPPDRARRPGGPAAAPDRVRGLAGRHRPGDRRYRRAGWCGGALAGRAPAGAPRPGGPPRQVRARHGGARSRADQQERPGHRGRLRCERPERDGRTAGRGAGRPAVAGGVPPGGSIADHTAGRAHRGHADRGAGREGRWRAAPGRADQRPRPGHVRAVLLHRGHLGQRRPGRLCRCQRLPGRAGRPARGGRALRPRRSPGGHGLVRAWAADPRPSASCASVA